MIKITNELKNESASCISELINSFLPTKKSEKNAWTMKSELFMIALIKVLVSLRDSNEIILDINAIRKFLDFSECEKLIKRKDIPESDIAGLKHYVLNLPGYNVDDDEQKFDVLQQHGFITMQFINILNMLSDDNY